MYHDQVLSWMVLSGRATPKRSPLICVRHACVCGEAVGVLRRGKKEPSATPDRRAPRGGAVGPLSPFSEAGHVIDISPTEAWCVRMRGVPLRLSEDLHNRPHYQEKPIWKTPPLLHPHSSGR
ncbi:hypothetical protein JTE90_019250 [Oedothorax gibbosus]|uniref:Uncharacterized protein n=1 Tax=Oedothorax gibbosus TaxID=931172 RepID=A0AAV6UU36_9ARAC|nr:hypothetical protein JTE90_019250 [Oedothorax gibbosus]